MTNAITSMRCPACAGSFTPERHCWLFVCTDCGLLTSSIEIRVNAGSMTLDELTRETALREIRQTAFKTILDVLSQSGLPAQAHILDVGCAHGWFMQQAASRGYKALGIEPDHAVASIAVKRNLDVRIGFFPDALEHSETFEAIVFNDVFEHLPDIAIAVDAVRAHLRRGGLLIINIPLSTGFFYRLADTLDRIGFRAPFERMWQKNFPSPHRYYLNSGNLTQLAERYGFKRIVARHLTSLRPSGLWQRLRYDKSQSLVWTLLMWPLLVALIPMSNLLPQDIGLFVFRMEGDNA